PRHHHRFLPPIPNIACEHFFLFVQRTWGRKLIEMRRLAVRHNATLRRPRNTRLLRSNGLLLRDHSSCCFRAQGCNWGLPSHIYVRCIRLARQQKGDYGNNPEPECGCRQSPTPASCTETLTFG